MSSSNGTEIRGEGMTLNHHSPAYAYCPTCSKNVVTEVRISYSKIAHLTCIVCVLSGCLFGCCLLPYFSMCFVTAKHYCPDCGGYLGSYNPLLEVLS
ncbi:lipopolysaccharide-induced tumor necrosis factor-alpha factor homolog [Athalia rosae]|uniref:lipopolysaccharide-induced tumor necrosis factor-alpha factor homolog n=1 Tax=Athalia rosae TaxID=37344 RepID=UPI002034A204|nr:lipopolysaccharide-induced tumor necrosis factor-alpha factor homolog [Athalia rosae]XP_048509803.1 lipopolysaccharide-induced tumor necrosis factor-alpha factor homolog [Athalia rosae]